uniref:Uncharacterized protein n=1 Tax=Anguilla anguilla TaxID=7936 RepID=A0A0E9QEF7_ANGAN
MKLFTFSFNEISCIKQVKLYRSWIIISLPSRVQNLRVILI